MSLGQPMDEGSKTSDNNKSAEPDFTNMTEEEQIAYAMQISMQGKQHN